LADYKRNLWRTGVSISLVIVTAPDGTETGEINSKKKIR